MSELTDGLRNVGNLHEFAELFGFNWHDDSDWTWHDVAVKMADEIDTAWNTRAVETCELICHEVELPDSLKDAGVEILVFECSECGERMFSDYNYCPNCGRKVVGE